VCRMGRRGAQSVVTTPFDNFAAGIGEMGDASFMILLREIPVPLIIRSVSAALNDFVYPLPIHVKANHGIVYVVFQDRLLPIVNVIGGNTARGHGPFHATAKRVVGELVS